MRQRKALGLLAATAVAGLFLAACGKSAAPAETVNVQAAPEAAAPAPQAPAPAAVPDAVAPAAVPDAAAVPAQATENIVQIAAGNPDFSTLVTAVQAAGLADTLSGPGPFTVFAPTNEAFAKIPAPTLQMILADKATLTKILTYHVVPGKVLSSDITPGDVATVEGSTVTLSVDGSTVKVNSSTVVQADIEASNGVIHAIDSVLLPPDVALMPATR